MDVVLNLDGSQVFVALGFSASGCSSCLRLSGFLSPTFPTFRFTCAGHLTLNRCFKLQLRLCGLQHWPGAERRKAVEAKEVALEAQAGPPAFLRREGAAERILGL